MSVNGLGILSDWISHFTGDKSINSLFTVLKMTTNFWWTGMAIDVFTRHDELSVNFVSFSSFFPIAVRGKMMNPHKQIALNLQLHLQQQLHLFNCIYNIYISTTTYKWLCKTASQIISFTPIQRIALLTKVRLADGETSGWGITSSGHLSKVPLQVSTLGLLRTIQVHIHGTHTSTLHI